LFRNIVKIDTLLANLRHASTNWWKVKKNKSQLIASYTHHNQARNQLGTPGGAKSLLRGVQIFWTVSNNFKLYPTHFSRGPS